ncbi:MAG: hypothetical protein E6J34_00615 [Chloroflexi bacterium]|nr:MAG: hypothetical protein E6J34_00615 [Chloroflexota bacterium]
MITQIEIDGFKTFKDFKVELAPFQVIVPTIRPRPYHHPPNAQSASISVNIIHSFVQQSPNRYTT